MKSILAALPLLVLSACAPPLISEKYVSHPPEKTFNGTGHGVYCLASDSFTLTVRKNKVTADQVGADNEYSITLDQTTVPDAARLYRLGLNESIWSDDKITVTYFKSTPPKPKDGEASEVGSGTCLLASLSSEATDQSGASATIFSKLIISAVTGVPQKVNNGSGPQSSAAESGGAYTAFQKTFRVTDGPLLANTVQQINAGLESSGFDIRVNIARQGDSLAPALADAEYYGTAEDGVDRNVANNPYRSRFGIFARVPQTYVFSAYRVERKKGVEIGRRLFEEKEITSREGLDPYFVSIDRGAFTKRTVTISFTDGAVDKIETDKKSEILAFLNIPLDIVTEILNAPLSALRWNNTLTTSESTLLKSQAALIKDQADLIKAQQDARKAAQNNGQGKEPGGAD